VSRPTSGALLRHWVTVETARQAEPERDERVNLPLDPESALRALLALDPDDEPADLRRTRLETAATTRSAARRFPRGGESPVSVDRGDQLAFPQHFQGAPAEGAHPDVQIGFSDEAAVQDHTNCLCEQRRLART